MKNQEKSLENRTTGQITETEKTTERNRRKAFLGLQIKYTLAPILWLYGIVFVVLTGMFLYNWFAKVVNAEWEVSFLEQLRALPLGVSFFVLVIGVQIILAVGFAKQKKNELAIMRVQLPKETQSLLYWWYSFLVTVSAFLVYFLLLCLLLILENCLAPESAYGAMELYPAFYHFSHLYRIYPVVSLWMVPALVICMATVSVLAPMTISNKWENEWRSRIWMFFVLLSFLFYCFENEDIEILILELILMVIYGVDYIGRAVLAYRRRRKDDRA